MDTLTHMMRYMFNHVVFFKHHFASSQCILVVIGVWEDGERSKTRGPSLEIGLVMDKIGASCLGHQMMESATTSFQVQSMIFASIDTTDLISSHMIQLVQGVRLGALYNAPTTILS